MITICVDSDEEEALVLAALKDGKIWIGDGLPFILRRGNHSIGGRGINVVSFATSGEILIAGGCGAGGAAGPVTITGGTGATLPDRGHREGCDEDGKP